MAQAFLQVKEYMHRLCKYRLRLYVCVIGRRAHFRASLESRGAPDAPLALRRPWRTHGRCNLSEDIAG